MKRQFLGVALAAGILLSGAPAAAQLGSLGGLLGGQTGAGNNTDGGASSLLGGMLPNVGGSSMGNAAGVLSYCVKNKILGGSGATSALGSLLGKHEVTSSKGFKAGQSGNLLTGGGQGLSLGSVKGKIKSKVCDMVLQHAKSFL